MSFADKMQLVHGVLQMSALTVIIFLRRRIGYRLLHPVQIIVMTFALILLSTFKQYTPNAEAMVVFAILMCVFGFLHKARSWQDMRRGLLNHSFYLGDSTFEAKFLPKFLTRNRRFTRTFDPLFCLGAGACLLDFSPVLGGWLIFSGFALCAVEHRAYQTHFERDLDTVDGLILSGVQADTAERYSESPAAGQASGPGISTGLSPDLENKIGQRQSK